MKQKLIIIDGIMGSGKSTTGQMIHEVLSENGQPSRYISEGTRPHPTQVVRTRTAQEHLETSRQKWLSFIEEVDGSDETTILDGQLLHFNVDFLLMLNADPVTRHREHRIILA